MIHKITINTYNFFIFFLHLFILHKNKKFKKKCRKWRRHSHCIYLRANHHKDCKLFHTASIYDLVSDTFILYAYFCINVKSTTNALCIFRGKNACMCAFINKNVFTNADLPILEGLLRWISTAACITNIILALYSFSKNFKSVVQSPNLG